MKNYKYLDIDFCNDYNRPLCVQEKVDCDYKAIYLSINRCERCVKIVSWKIMIFLFKSLVLSEILYGIQVYDHGCKKVGGEWRVCKISFYKKNQK